MGNTKAGKAFNYDADYDPNHRGTTIEALMTLLKLTVAGRSVGQPRPIWERMPWPCSVSANATKPKREEESAMGIAKGYRM